MGNNVTIAHLKNLVIDKPAPITTKLAQTSGNDFALMDNNVTISHLKNLVIDKPAPITTKLAQVKGNDFALMDNNVTIGHLKNLVIDKPAPITVKLAQTGTLPDFDPTRPATIDGTSGIVGMSGEEEIHGPMRVGGSN